MTKYKDTGLNPETNYSYKVRAYNTVKKKHWYNKKTGKWQIKKPAKKYRGKSKKMKVKVYGSYSATITIKTTGVLKMTDGGYTFTASEVKAAGGLIELDALTSQCPNCDVYGEKVTFTYDGKDLHSKISGTDYSKKCHHCDGVTVTGRCGDRWFTTEGELDLETHKLKNNETLRDHKNYENVVEGSEPSDCKKTITVAGSETDPDSYKKYVYCFKCGKLEVKPTDVPSGWSFDPRQ